MRLPNKPNSFRLLACGIISIMLLHSNMANAELAYWSDTLKKSHDKFYLSHAGIEEKLQETTPAYYNPKITQQNLLSYSDTYLFMVDDTLIELDALKNNPDWSGFGNVIDQLMTFSMKEDNYPIRIGKLPAPWILFEPRLGNWQQAVNNPLAASATQGTDNYWLTDTFQFSDRFQHYRKRKAE